MQASPDGADRLLDEDQLGSITSKSVVLPHSNIGGLDLFEIPPHELVAGSVSVGVGLGRVLVLGHHDEPLGSGPTLHHLAMLLDRGLILRGGRVPVIRDDHLVIVVLRMQLHPVAPISLDRVRSLLNKFTDDSPRQTEVHVGRVEEVLCLRPPSPPHDLVGGR